MLLSAWIRAAGASGGAHCGGGNEGGPSHRRAETGAGAAGELADLLLRSRRRHSGGEPDPAEPARFEGAALASVVQAAAAAADIDDGCGGGSMRASWAAHALAAACPEDWRPVLAHRGGGGSSGGGVVWNLRAAAVSHQVYRALAPSEASGDARRVLRSLTALLRAARSAAAVDGAPAAADREEVAAATAAVAAEAVRTLRGLVRAIRPARLLLLPQVTRCCQHRHHGLDLWGLCRRPPAAGRGPDPE